MTHIDSSNFLPIPGFANYEVSDRGLVRNVRTGRTIKPYVHAAGYLRVSLFREGKQFRHYVHRLVLLTHAPVEGSDKLTVNHLDGDKLDNRLSNLEFCTAAENNKHSRDVLGNKGFGPDRPVSLCDGRRFPSLSAAARALGRDYTAVRHAIARGTRCAGFRVSASSAA